MVRPFVEHQAWPTGTFPLRETSRQPPGDPCPEPASRPGTALGHKHSIGRARRRCAKCIVYPATRTEKALLRSSPLARIETLINCCKRSLSISRASHAPFPCSVGCSLACLSACSRASWRSSASSCADSFAGSVSFLSACSSASWRWSASSCAGACAGTGGRGCACSRISVSGSSDSSLISAPLVGNPTEQVIKAGNDQDPNHRAR